ncbi:HdeD family acid-resistance protein [Roseiarcaceae bacterium H3SJ34-1]|uniref:HdeD family acid-resistance protein n=1 Tax=Terripilifer ovatus TaxID=3032367 RepID=UPI003AB98259|nr:HdeD family acid-resistance protein [Roseiarcaceae bacterium H3SJ34-1]
MADASNAAYVPAPLDVLRAKWGWIVALGVVYVIAGALALASVAMATVVSVLIVGFMMLLSGVAEVINAFQFKSWSKFLLWLFLGLLYVASGIITFMNPLLAAAVLTLLLGVTLIVSGIMRIVLAYSMKQGSPWIWVVVSGVLTLLLGLVIVSGWPVSSLYILGMFLGIDLVFVGAAWIGLGLGVKSQPATAPAA